MFNLVARASFLPALMVTGVLLFAVPAVAQACGEVDLVVKKTGPATVAPGQNVEYTVTLRQVANGTAINTYLYEEFPASLIPISQINVSGHSPFNCHPGITCYLRKTFKGDVRVMKFVFKVAADTPCGSTVVNRVRVKSDENDKNGSNNRDQAASTVVCPTTPTPTPTPTITPTATPTPTSTPTTTPTPTATPTPTPGPDKDIHIVKTDNRDITRPGHTLTYVITVENTGDTDLHDVKVEDTIPDKLSVASISNGGTRSGRTITWYDIVLDVGQKKILTFTAKVHENTGNGHILHNFAKACSADHDVCDDATDETRVERLPKVVSVVAPKAVPVTARTGAASTVMSLTALLSGIFGANYLNRRNK